MTTTVDYLPIANGSGANVESQAQYVIDLGSGGSLQDGYQSGLAKSIQVNKTLRQSSMIAAAVANFIANALNTNVIDDGNVATLTTNLTNAIQATASPVGLVNDSLTGSTYTLQASDGGKYLSPQSANNFTLTLATGLPLGARIGATAKATFTNAIVIPAGITVSGMGQNWTNTTITIPATSLGSEVIIFSYDAAGFFLIEQMTPLTAESLGVLGALASLNVGTGLLSSGGNLTINRSVSAATALPAAAGTATIAHGLGARPAAIYMQLVCETAEFGFSVGDQIVLQPGMQNEATNQYGILTYTDATNVYVGVASSGLIGTFNKSTLAACNITLTNWKLIVTAWL